MHWFTVRNTNKITEAVSAYIRFINQLFELQLFDLTRLTFAHTLTFAFHSELMLLLSLSLLPLLLLLLVVALASHGAQERGGVREHGKGAGRRARVRLCHGRDFGALRLLLFAVLRWLLFVLLLHMIW